MNVGAILGILIWLTGAWLTFGFINTIRRDERRGTGSTKASVTMTMLWSISLILIPVLDMSPYHLLWMFPTSSAIGFLSTVFPFLMEDFKRLSGWRRAISILALVLLFSPLLIPGRLFWKLCCIGIDWQEAAKNRQKYDRFSKLLADGLTPKEAAQRVEQEEILPESKAVFASKRLTYKPGAYSQVLLPDGKRVFVQVRPTAITVRRQILAGFLPSSLLWSFDVPFLIRKVSAAGEPGVSMMEVVLRALESCQSLSDVASHLDEAAKPQLLSIINRSSASQ